jgi:hypothetical protein
MMNETGPGPVTIDDMLDRRRLVMASWARHVIGAGAHVVRMVDRG